jgi:hypothetical protein
VKKLLRPSAPGLVLAGLHSAGVLLAWFSVVASRGTFLNGIQWLPIAAIDFPVTLVASIWEESPLDAHPTVVGLMFLIGGGIYWLWIGAAVRAGWRRFLRRLEWG